jgi:uncharacterized membrane protein (GlpM family)
MKINDRFIWWTIIFLAFIVVLFAALPPFNYWNCNLDSNLFAQYGTFAGSILLFCSILLVYLTLKHQKESSDFERFQTNFFKLIDYFNNYVHSLSYSIKTTKTKRMHKNNNSIVQYVYEKKEGFEVFEYFAKELLDQKESVSFAGMKERFYQYVKNCYHSRFNQLFENLVQIFKYIDRYEDTHNDTNLYYTVIITQINPYLKFIIAIYYLLDDNEYAKSLIANFKIIKYGDFDNYIRNKETLEEIYKRLNLS